jgi:hypothetical protein
MSFVVNSRKLVVASPRGRGLRAVARPAGDVHIAVGADSRPLSTGAFAMLATRPATSPTLAPFQLLLGPADATLPRYLLLGILDPADEFVAGQRRDVIPGIECGDVGDQRLAQVSWKLVHHPTGYSRAAHEVTVAGQGESGIHPRGPVRVIRKSPSQMEDPRPAGDLDRRAASVLTNPRTADYPI